MQTLSFNTIINLVEEGKWLFGVTFFECTNSVFNINNKNNSFSITIPGHWNSKSTEKTIAELNELLELRSENQVELHVDQVKKKRSQILREDKKINFLNLMLVKTIYLMN